MQSPFLGIFKWNYSPNSGLQQANGKTLPTNAASVSTSLQK